MAIEKHIYGSLADGTEIEKYVLSNANNISVEVITYGGTVIAVNMPDKKGMVKNVCLGFDKLKGYLSDDHYFGCLVGRFANRIGNGSFKLKGVEYKLAKNENGVTHLHGGKKGFDKVVWNAEPFESEDVSGVTLKYVSEDGEEGYPGELDVTVVYSLNEENEFSINYKAETDAPTPINLTNHAYWNFGGEGSGDVLGHLLRLNCDKYLATDDKSIPTGSIVNAAGTPFDFRKAKAIGQDIKEAGGYDLAFVVQEHEEDELYKAAQVQDPVTGRGMKVLTTKPAIQLYTGDYLDGVKGADGHVYGKHAGLCLETEFYPDAVNKSFFPSAILMPGDTYHHITIHKLFVE